MGRTWRNKLCHAIASATLVVLGGCPSPVCDELFRPKKTVDLFSFVDPSVKRPLKATLWFTIRRLLTKFDISNDWSTGTRYGFLICHPSLPMTSRISRKLKPLNADFGSPMPTYFWTSYWTAWYIRGNWRWVELSESSTIVSFTSSLFSHQYQHSGKSKRNQVHQILNNNHKQNESLYNSS